MTMFNACCACFVKHSNSFYEDYPPENEGKTSLVLLCIVMTTLPKELKHEVTEDISMHVE